jgi:hypothetical protein
VADVTKSVEYIGPPAFVGALAQCLREEGVEVDYEPPIEERGGTEVAREVVIGIMANGAWAAIVLGVKKYRKRFGKGRVKLEGEDDE